MDDNTALTLQILGICLLFGGAFWAMAWGASKASAPASLPEQPMFTYSTKTTTTYFDDDDDDDFPDWYDDPDDDWEDERQQLRDRLAAALWENRSLKRKVQRLRKVGVYWCNRSFAAERGIRPADDQVAWRADEMIRQAGESEVA